ncbi:MAG: hypothetical protein E7012_05955 [Alphaproteobacteria bacterium]|nr:hypothetical protein [Alphaproteobacteria bacterium]
MTIDSSVKSKKMASYKYKKNLQDIRIWKKIRANGYEWVAIRLCRGYSYLCQVKSMKVSSWMEKVCYSFNPDGYGADEDKLLYLMRCRHDYLEWADNCEKNGVSHHAAMDILYFSKSCHDVERMNRHRHGWAISNLMKSFEFYRKRKSYPQGLTNGDNCCTK